MRFVNKLIATSSLVWFTSFVLCGLTIEPIGTYLFLISTCIFFICSILYISISKNRTYIAKTLSEITFIAGNLTYSFNHLTKNFKLFLSCFMLFWIIMTITGEYFLRSDECFPVAVKALDQNKSLRNEIGEVKFISPFISNKSIVWDESNKKTNLFCTIVGAKKAIKADIEIIKKEGNWETKIITDN